MFRLYSGLHGVCASRIDKVEQVRLVVEPGMHVGEVLELVHHPQHAA